MAGSGQDAVLHKAVQVHQQIQEVLQPGGRESDSKPDPEYRHHLQPDHQHCKQTEQARNYEIQQYSLS